MLLPAGMFSENFGRNMYSLMFLLAVGGILILFLVFIIIRWIFRSFNSTETTKEESNEELKK